MAPTALVEAFMAGAWKAEADSRSARATTAEDCMTALWFCAARDASQQCVSMPHSGEYARALGQQQGRARATRVDSAGSARVADICARHMCAVSRQGLAPRVGARGAAMSERCCTHFLCGMQREQSRMRKESISAFRQLSTAKLKAHPSSRWWAPEKALFAHIMAHRRRSAPAA